MRHLRLKGAVFGLFLFCSCAISFAFPLSDTSYNCTEVVYELFNILNKEDYRIVIGYRKDSYLGVTKQNGHTWIEYRKDGVWFVHDPVVIDKYEGVTFEYIPVVSGAVAFNYISAEQMYRNIGYEAHLIMGEVSDMETGEIKGYTFYVQYRDKGESIWHEEALGGVICEKTKEKRNYE